MPAPRDAETALVATASEEDAPTRPYAQRFAWYGLPLLGLLLVVGALAGLSWRSSTRTRSPSPEQGVSLFRASDLTDSMNSAIGSATDAATGGLTDAQEAVNGKVNNAKDTVVGKASDAQDALTSAGEIVDGVKDDVKDHVKGTVAGKIDDAQDALTSAHETLQDAKESLEK